MKFTTLKGIPYLIAVQLIASALIASPASKHDTVGTIDADDANPGYLSVEPSTTFERNVLKGSALKQKTRGDERFFEHRTYSQILADGIVQGGALNIAPIEKALTELAAREAAYKKVAKPKDDDGVLISYHFAEKKLNQALLQVAQLQTQRTPLTAQSLNSSRFYPFYQDLFQGLEVSSSLKNMSPDGEALALEKDMFKQLSPAIVIKNGPEATNLGPATSNGRAAKSTSAFSPEVLAQNNDLSQLDPVGSLLWHRRASIADFKTINYNGLANDYVPAEITDPSMIAAVTYYRPSSHGQTAKIYVKASDSQVYKIKLDVPRLNPTNFNTLANSFNAYFAQSAETRTQTAANNIASALGFNVNPTFVKHDIRMYFKGDGFGTADHAKKFDEARAQASAEMEATQRGSGVTATRHNYAALFEDAKVRTDEKGRKYINIETGAFNRKWNAKTVINAGPVERAAFNRQFFRDHRGLALLAALLADGDTKPDNTNVVLVNKGNDEYQMAYVPSDMGATFGWSMSKEQPNLYTWNFVNSAKSVKGKKIVLTFRTTRKDPIFNSITVNDARWFARLLGQLTRQQVLDAFTGAGYVSPMRELLTEKLLKRRDDLVEWTGATDVTPQKLSTVTSAEEAKHFVVAGYESYFKDGDIIKAAPGMDERQTMSVKDTSKEAPLEKFKTAMTKTALTMGINAGEENLDKVQGTFVESRLGRARVVGCVAEFIPRLVYLPNGTDTNKPWLEVKIWSFGFCEAAKTSFDLPGALHDPKGFAPVSVVKELIQVRAVTTRDISPVTAAKFNLDYKNFGVDAVKGITQKLITSSTFQVGDVLLQNTYITAGAIFDSRPGFFSAGYRVAAGLTLSHINQLMIMKTGESEVIANWRKGFDRKLQADGGVALSFIHLDAFEAKIEKETDNDKTFKFDLGHADQSIDLMTNLHKIAPSFSASKPEIVFDRDIEKRIGTVVLSLFGIATKSASKVDLKVVEKASDGQVNKTLVETVTQHRKRSYIFGHGDTINDSMIISARKIDARDATNMSLKFDFKYARSYATLKDYKHLYNEALTIMPAELMNYQPSTLFANPLLGTLTFNGSLEFKLDALNEIFGKNRSRLDVCERYYEHIPLVMVNADQSNWPASQWCSAVMPDSKPLLPDEFAKAHKITPTTKALEVQEAAYETVEFVNAYMNAQQKFSKVESKGLGQLTLSGDKKTREKAMHAVASALDALRGLGTRSKALRTRVDTLISWVDKGHVVSEGELASSIDGFTGAQGKISVAAQDQHGNAYDDAGVQMTHAAVDAINLKIKNVTYDQYRIESRQYQNKLDLLHTAKTSLDPQ